MKSPRKVLGSSASNGARVRRESLRGPDVHPANIPRDQRNVPPETDILARPTDWRILAGCAALVACAIAVYSRTYSFPFIFDDIPTILSNSTIQHVGTALAPPARTTASGRPIVNLSLAINYAISGTDVWSYHAFNSAVHILAGLTLFGVVRRILTRLSVPGALSIAFCTALLWTLHPLQTESVTYIVQRAESLMGLFFLQTIYWFVRWQDPGTGSPPAARTGVLFAVMSIVFCAFGMGTKEVMVSAPLIVLLLDRLCFAGSFAEAWRRRKTYYIGMAATWAPLAVLVWHAGNRSGNSGFGSGVSVWKYWSTQPEAIGRYLKLAFWPHPLVFDYGTQWLWTPGHPAGLGLIVSRLLWPAAVVAVLAIITGYGFLRNTAIGVLGFFFFAILAPTSIIPGNKQTAADHRMYLALIPVILLVVLEIHRRLGRAAFAACLCLAGAAALVTFRRNLDYSSETAIWSNTVASNPNNPSAHNNLGKALAKIPGRTSDAIAQFEEAIRLRPDLAEAHNNLATLLSGLPERLNDAIAQYQEAIRLEPDFAEAHYNLAAAWLSVPGRLNDAVAQYEEAVRLNPGFFQARNNLGAALATMPGRLNDAIGQYEEAIRLKPDFADAHNNLGNALAKSPGHLKDAIAQYEEAIRLRPDFADAHNNLGILFSAVPERMNEAMAQYEEAIRLRPDFAEAHNNLGILLSTEQGRLNDAIAQYEEAIRLRPDFADAHFNLGAAWFKLPGHLDDAIAQFENAIRLNPDNAEAHNNLGTALGTIPGGLNDAVVQFEEAVRLAPDYADARFNLGAVLASFPGRLNEAVAQFEYVIRLRPDDPQAHFSLAVALLKMPGRRGEAKAHLQEVLRLEPANGPAREILESITTSTKEPGSD